MTDIINNRYKTYLIGSMESPAKEDAGESWRKEITPLLNQRNIYCFDPTKEESQKVGIPTKELIQKLHGWQVSGNWDKFVQYMRMIWKGVSKIDTDPETNEPRNIHILGDVDYVRHSDFIVWYYEEGDQLGGTIAEIVLAWNSGIPVYLISSAAKSRMNKSLIYFVLDSGNESQRGQMFNSINDFLDFFDKVYGGK
jgi:hypothetical protein